MERSSRRRLCAPTAAGTRRSVSLPAIGYRLLAIGFLLPPVTKGLFFCRIPDPNSVIPDLESANLPDFPHPSIKTEYGLFCCEPLIKTLESRFFIRVGRNRVNINRGKCHSPARIKRNGNGIPAVSSVLHTRFFDRRAPEAPVPPFFRVDGDFVVDLTRARLD